MLELRASIHEFSSAGALLNKFAEYGDGDGQVYGVSGIALDSTGKISVLDNDNARIEVFGADGSYAGQLGVSYNTVNIAIDGSDALYLADRLNQQVGVYGSGTKYSYMSGDLIHLGAPNSAAIGPDGNLYVSDDDANNIKIYDPATSALIRTIGTSGAGDGQLSEPSGIAFSTNGTLYIADSGNNRIEEFSSAGAYIGQFGSYGSGNGQFDYPIDVAVDDSGDVYVADRWNSRIEKFDRNGTYISQFGAVGSGDGQFNGLSAIAFDSHGDLYATDSYNYRIEKFDRNGTYISQFGTQSNICDGTTDDGSFCSPTIMAIDAFDNIYVGDGDGYVKKFDSAGGYRSKFGGMGTAANEFSDSLTGLALDSTGAIYIVDSNNSRVSVWNAPTVP